MTTLEESLLLAEPKNKSKQPILQYVVLCIAASFRDIMLRKNVFFQIRVKRETFLTYGACERPFSCVSHNVTTQVSWV